MSLPAINLRLITLTLLHKVDFILLKARANPSKIKVLLNFKRLKRDHFYYLLQTIFLTNAKSSCFKSDRSRCNIL